MFLAIVFLQSRAKTMSVSFLLPQSDLKLLYFLKACHFHICRLNLQACFLFRWHAAYEQSQDLRLMHRMAVLNHEKILQREYFLVWRDRYHIALDINLKWVSHDWVSVHSKCDRSPRGSHGDTCDCSGKTQKRYS